ncbi:hypothetical protein ACI3LY_001937 [Candidozyma auris]|uniref:Uncharacterized protein n=1 Tax=Candidozyma auris TaxID=498019 RepID=A0A2H0ZQT9_CANAR|nr:hypothetical_protein [[Candida] auris]KND96479.2 hypothetical protein QG37_07216 [[Candida] auris]PIS51055.1 hypothetical protein B9J08_002626 [[Candida] auris]PIS53021.1 hypothetical protein CJI97_002679 [[Candida] auris]QEO19691.1 hypothetical_protein [[Candida] auris]GBL50326.1 hypothetical protein CAJCM15448_26000 [[Candida] auris]
MVVGIAFSTKAAFTIGALIGGTVAILANRDKLLELSAELLQKGADLCNEQIEKNRIKMAASLDDGELAIFSQEEELAQNSSSSMSSRKLSRRNSESLVSSPESVHPISDTDDVLTEEESDMDGWQSAHLSESDFSESYEEIDSEPVSRARSSGCMSVRSLD